jgi:Transglycosylase SLT domain
MLAEATAATQTRSDVIAALHQASAETGSNFDYLLGTAMRESSLKPQAKSSTSSATGLFQFVDQTWLGLVKQHGAKFGLGSYAGAIQQNSDGRYETDNPADRQAILALRNDPKVSALMEGEYANETRSTLESSLGRGVCNGELYAAHFLGPEAACKLIKMSENQPAASAAGAFPAAASANKSVFYKADGSPKTVRDVYDWALKQPSTSRALDEQASDTQAAAPITNAPMVFSGDSSFSRTNDWAALQLYSATNTSSLDSTANLPQAPFAVTSDIVEMLGKMHAPTTPGHPHRMQ